MIDIHLEYYDINTDELHSSDYTAIDTNEAFDIIYSNLNEIKASQSEINNDNSYVHVYTDDDNSVYSIRDYLDI